ncbi:MAG: ribosomal-protein-alanine N-acetyltransferase [Methanosaeta sp. PtaU1.Bin060]|nr:MAG: ribosomal-protein-alanine N-acetyltransferase [Methanosaeta sp. PtaU1.Bin060]
MDWRERCRFRDMTNSDIIDIIAITKENMSEIIRYTWGALRDQNYEECFIKNLISVGTVKTIYSNSFIIGYFWFNEINNEERLFINSIRIKFDYQRRGIGTQAMKRLEHEALAHGIRHLRLSVQVINLKAIEFYRSSGFQEVFQEGGATHMHKEIFQGP